MDESRSKEHGRWLNRAICLRPNRRTRKHEVVQLTECLYDELGLAGYKRAAKESALNCILSNLYLGNWLGGVPVMFSRRSKHYSMPRRYRYGFFTRHIILPIIDGLEEVRETRGQYDHRVNVRDLLDVSVLPIDLIYRDSMTTIVREQEQFSMRLE